MTSRIQNVLFFIIAFSFSKEGIGQKLDKVFKRDNTVIDCKINEMSATEIKYRKASYLDGPTYTIKKSEIATILYANGESEVFPLLVEPVQQNGGGAGIPPTSNTRENRNYSTKGEQFVKYQHEDLLGEAKITITKKGVTGYFEITNTSNQDLYFESSLATAEVLEEGYDNKDKYYKNWRKQKLSFASLFMKAGSKARLSQSGNDNSLLSTLLGNESYFTEVRGLKITLGEKKIPTYSVPDSATKLNIDGTTKLFEIDGVTYSVSMSKTGNYFGNGFWDYKFTFSAINNNPQKIKFLGAIKFGLFFNGIGRNYELKLNTIRSFKEDTESFQVADAFNYDPISYIKFEYIPPIEGISSGNQISRVYQK